MKSEIVSAKRGQQIQEFADEFINAGSSLDGSLGLGRAKSCEEWLDYVTIHKNKNSLPDGHVVTSVYFAVREEDDRIVGIFNVRHYLNDVLINSGNGNIGYCVRPTERCKDYGTKILEMAIEECRKLKMDKVHVSCFKSNLPSEKIILKNGGKLYRRHNREIGEFLEYIIQI